MSRLLCPDCARVLAVRRRNGAVKPKTSILLENGVVVLICPDCGGRRVVADVVPYLLPIG